MTYEEDLICLEVSASCFGRRLRKDDESLFLKTIQRYYNMFISFCARVYKNFKISCLSVCVYVLMGLRGCFKGSVSSFLVFLQINCTSTGDDAGT